MKKLPELPIILPHREWNPSAAKKVPRSLEVLCRHKIGETIARIDLEEERKTQWKDILESLKLPRLFDLKILMCIQMFKDVFLLMELLPRREKYYQLNQNFE
jgi:hypothetical protein